MLKFSNRNVKLNYLILQDVSGQNVAIKCIKKKSLSKRGADNLITEIQVLKDLKHRHIVQLYDFTVSLLFYLL